MTAKKQATALGMDGLEYWPLGPVVQGDKMQREVAYFCPQCCGNELSLGRLQDSEGAVSATCGLCKWSGRSTEVLGAIAPSNTQFWNAEKIGNVMMVALAKHGAGPLLQVLELIGVLPPIPVSAEGTLTVERLAEVESAQECRNRVMQAVVGAAVTAAYETAAEVVAPHYAVYNQDQGAAVERAFQFAGAENVH